MYKKISAALLLLIVLLGMQGCGPSYVATEQFVFEQPRHEYLLDSGWVCMNIKDVTSTGEVLSNRSFPLPDWMPATVPGTVLTTLLNNNLIPDPFYGMNDQKIPDIYETGPDRYTYWFVKDFKEKAPIGGEQVWLHFRGVNYGCDVYFNGNRLNKQTHFGMFLRQTYNITSYMSKNGYNRLAVLVYPPDPVGNPNGGQGGDGTIARNVSSQYVAGWDWIQPMRDRNTGIWDKVSIEKTNTVEIKNPYVVTSVPGKRILGQSQAPAVIKASVEIENPTGTPVQGTLRYVLDENIVSKQVTLQADSTEEIQLPDYILNNPKLWWPNGYGQPSLYTIKFQFISSDNLLMDEKDLTIGIRQIQTRWNEHTQSREVFVNGQRIFIKGGDWIVSDAMLRLSSERYDAEARFHRDMNLNLIRVWGGGITERPEFYDACDKYGILVFQDFWMSGDCNGRWADPSKLDDQWVRRGYPDDHKLFLASVTDQVKMLRNHPSLAFYCGGNEITPPEDILVALQDSLLPALDSTRYFFSYSNVDSMSYNSVGYTGDGPYRLEPPGFFWENRSFPFNSEIGSVGMGDYESLARFIPALDMEVPDSDYAKIDSVWRYHKYSSYGNYVGAYGKSRDVRAFADRAQLINYDQYRSLIEGHLSHMWDWYTGVIIWKTQNPWTAMRGQMYDCYLDPNAGLYGLHHGGEPLHAMYNPADGMVSVVNQTFNPYHDLVLQATAYDMAGKDTLVSRLFIELSPNSVQKYFSAKRVTDALFSSQGGFLSLRLLDTSHKVLSDNLYWLPDSTGNYTGLPRMFVAQVNSEARKAGDGRIAVTISNPSGEPVAFFNRISLVDSLRKERILPVFYSDNYISVLPGEEKTVYIEYTPAVNAAGAMVSISGWNVDQKYLDIR
ncbi:MAG: glycosyl hydrolase [Candidatus Kryptoniota bacterium]